MASLLEREVGDLDLFITGKLVGFVAADSERVLFARTNEKFVVSINIYNALNCSSKVLKVFYHSTTKENHF